MEIGPDAPCYIIAEGGVAHNGDIKKALELVDIAKHSGSNAIKFQIYKTHNFISKKHLPDWYKKYKLKELSYLEWRWVREYADRVGITFLATAHDDESFEFVKSLHVPMYKIGSGELGNWDYIKRVASAGKPVIVSTGMYQRADIERVWNIFEDVGNPDYVLMHCVTAYPTLSTDANMKRMLDICRDFECCVGYSDHTIGSLFPLMSVAMGADVLEKHIMREDDSRTGNDWFVSLTKHELKELVENIRHIERGLGKGINAERIQAERDNEKWATKRMVDGKMLRA